MNNNCALEKPGILDSLEILKAAGPNASLTEEEYFILGERACDEVRRYCSNLSLWNAYSQKDGIEMFERKSDLPHATESMLLAIVTIPCSMEKVVKLVSPWLEYRLKWDSMLQDAKVLQSWPDKEVYVLQHLIKKLLTISARESVDIVKVVRRENEIVFGSTGTSHSGYVPSKSFIKTHQHLSGYVLRPCDSNPAHTKFHMLFHADLNLSGPKMLTNVAVKFKPRLMCQKLDNLRKAVEEYDI